jgi:hypothetical protein
MEKLPRAFRVFTEEGSVLLMRLDPQHMLAGRQFGRMRVRGHAVTTNYEIDWTGEGACEPVAGGKVIVHPEPLEVYEVLGQRVKSFPQETIARVEEIPVPRHIAEAAVARQEP